MLLNLRCSAVCAIGLALAAGSAAADVVYSDTEFATSTWGFETLMGGTGGTSAASQVGGGNPGNARQLANTVNGGGSGEIYGFSRYGTTNAVGRYDPVVLGAISSVNWSIDSKWLSGLGGQGQAILFGAKQGSFVYFADSDVTGSSGAWTAHGAVGLTAGSFQPLSAGAVPPLNFSATGAPIRFGFIVGNSGSFAYSNTVIYDNFNVRIVPSPGAAGLAGLAGLCGLRRRRARR